MYSFPAIQTPVCDHCTSSQSRFSSITCKTSNFIIFQSNMSWMCTLNNNNWSIWSLSWTRTKEELLAMQKNYKLAECNLDKLTVILTWHNLNYASFLCSAFVIKLLLFPKSLLTDLNFNSYLFILDPPTAVWFILQIIHSAVYCHLNLYTAFTIQSSHSKPTSNNNTICKSKFQKQTH